MNREIRDWWQPERGWHPTKRLASVVSGACRDRGVGGAAKSTLMYPSGPGWLLRGRTTSAPVLCEVTSRKAWQAPVLWTRAPGARSRRFPGAGHGGPQCADLSDVAVPWPERITGNLRPPRCRYSQLRATLAGDEQRCRLRVPSNPASTRVPGLPAPAGYCALPGRPDTPSSPTWHTLLSSSAPLRSARSAQPHMRGTSGGPAPPGVRC